MTRRTDRIAEQLRAEIARILREEATDPRVRLVTITRVDVSPDLANASVFWSALDVDAPEGVDEKESGLASAASFVRNRLAHELPLRRVPALRFRYDPSFVLGSETLSLLHSLSGGESEEKG